jgi:hypothetical protein
MTTMTDDTMRWINICLSLVCLTVLLKTSIPKWREYTTKMKNYVMALGGMCVVIIEGALEFLFPGFMPDGLRVLLVFFLLLFLLTGLLRKEGYVKPHDPKHR